MRDVAAAAIGPAWAHSNEGAGQHCTLGPNSSPLDTNPRVSWICFVLTKSHTLCSGSSTHTHSYTNKTGAQRHRGMNPFKCIGSNMHRAHTHTHTLSCKWGAANGFQWERRRARLYPLSVEDLIIQNGPGPVTGLYGTPLHTRIRYSAAESPADGCSRAGPRWDSLWALAHSLSPFHLSLFLSMSTIHTNSGPQELFIVMSLEVRLHNILALSPSAHLLVFLSLSKFIFIQAVLARLFK